MAKNIFNLLFMRHGKATPEGTSDRSRPLSPRGLRDTILVGEAIFAKGVRIDKIICSPVVRTMQTLEQVQKSYKDAPVFLSDEIYTADSASGLLAAIEKSIANTGQSVLIIGHNPTISALVEVLSDKTIDMSPGDCHSLTITAGSWEEALALVGLWRVHFALVAKN
ncbi:MAG: phosphohistidine phosphatase SixA [Proteobacteria bacterium]|nr:phosphohistidine phosphatase SixA [Pseudomonadota bacterium]